MSDNKRISVAPTVQVLGLLQNMNYTPWFAIGEFVDNSITSFVKHIREFPNDERFTHLVVDIKWDDALNHLQITDNAAGIPDSEDGWKRALELGARNPDPTVLGVYGYGMKAAAFWWAPKISITSKVAGEYKSRTITMDIDEIQSQNLDFIDLKELPTPDRDRHGTTIVLKGLNPGRSYPRGMTLGKVRTYLASMYRSYLRGDDKFTHPRTGKAFLTINVQEQTLVAPSPQILSEPFWSKPSQPPEGSETVYWKKEVAFEVPNLRDPAHPSPPFKVTGWAGVLSTMSADSGLFLMFHGKGLVGVGQGAGQAAQDTYKPVKIFGPANGWRHRRLVAELDVSEFNKLNTSDGIKFSDQEREKFEEALEAELHRTLVYEMANNYRPHSKSDFSDNQLSQLQAFVNQAAVTAEAVSRSIEYETLENKPQELEPPVGLDRVSATHFVSTSSGQKVRVSTVFGDEENSWLQIYKSEETIPVIEVNMNHPFIQKYFTIPKNDPSGLLEVAIAIGIAELEKPELYPMRQILNARMDRYYKDIALTESDLGDVDEF